MGRLRNYMSFTLGFLVLPFMFLVLGVFNFVILGGENVTEAHAWIYLAVNAFIILLLPVIMIINGRKRNKVFSYGLLAFFVPVFLAALLVLYTVTKISKVTYSPFDHGELDSALNGISVPGQ